MSAHRGKPDAGIDSADMQYQVDSALCWLWALKTSAERKRSKVVIADAINAVRAMDRIITGRYHGRPIVSVGGGKGESDCE